MESNSITGAVRGGQEREADAEGTDNRGREQSTSADVEGRYRRQI